MEGIAPPVRYDVATYAFSGNCFMQNGTRRWGLLSRWLAGVDCKPLAHFGGSN
jgi:hypothetical protein